MGKQSKELPPWGYAVAGSSAAVLANALVYPLDMVKTRLQVQTLEHHDLVSGDTAQSHHHLTTWQTIKAIASTDGPSGLYFGVWGSLVGVASTNFAYFYWYSVVRELYLGVRQNVSAPTTAEELSLSASAGALAQIFTIPVSVITTRQQTQRKGEQKSFWTTGKEVIEAENGWTGLWKGLNASLVLVVNPAITYGAYQRFRAMLFPDRNSLRPLEAFFLGGLSKALATILTQPLIVAKVGLQSEPPPSRKGRPFTSFPEVMRYIVKEEGVSRLYKGIAPQLMKGLLVQGLLMMIKERSELLFILVYRYFRKMRLNSMRHFNITLAAIAKKLYPALIQ